MKAKKLLSLLLALAMVFALAACSSNNEPKASEEPEAREEIVVFAAASMTETLNQIKETYEKDHNVSRLRSRKAQTVTCSFPQARSR